MEALEGMVSILSYDMKRNRAYIILDKPIDRLVEMYNKIKSIIQNESPS